MLVCRHCGWENPGEAAFCTNCGRGLARGRGAEAGGAAETPASGGLPKLRPPSEGPARPVATLLDFRMPDEMLAELARIQQGRGVASVDGDDDAAGDPKPGAEVPRPQGFQVARIATLAEFDDELGERLGAGSVAAGTNAGAEPKPEVKAAPPRPAADAEPASRSKNRATDELAGLEPVEGGPTDAVDADAEAPPFVTDDGSPIDDAFAAADEPIDLGDFRTGAPAAREVVGFDTVDLPPEGEGDDDAEGDLDEASSDDEEVGGSIDELVSEAPEASDEPPSEPEALDAAAIAPTGADGDESTDGWDAQPGGDGALEKGEGPDKTSVMVSLSGAIPRSARAEDEGPVDLGQRLNDALFGAASRAPVDRPTLPEVDEPGATQPALALSDIARRIREEVRRSQPDFAGVDEDESASAGEQDRDESGSGDDGEAPASDRVGDAAADDDAFVESDPFEASDDLSEGGLAAGGANGTPAAARGRAAGGETGLEDADLDDPAFDDPALNAGELDDSGEDAARAAGRAAPPASPEAAAAPSAPSDPPASARSTRPEGFDVASAILAPPLAGFASSDDDDLDLVGAPLELRATPRNLGIGAQNASIDDDVPELDESLDASFDDILDLPDRSESMDAAGDPAFEDLVDPGQAMTIPPEVVVDDDSIGPRRMAAVAGGADALSETLNALDGPASPPLTPPRGHDPAEAADAPRPAGPPPLPGLGARFVLRVVSMGAGEGRLVALNGEALVIGTAAPVQVEDLFASEQHARVAVAGARVQVEDLDSLNGVWVRLRSGHALAVGDRFLVGRQILRVIREGSPGAASQVDGVQRLGARTESSGFRLQVLGADDSVIHDLRLPTEGCRIGRHLADLVFTDDDQLSATHAVVRPDAGAVRLDDLGSRNGTWIRARGAQSLGVGDAFMVGRTVWRISQPAR